MRGAILPAPPVCLQGMDRNNFTYFTNTIIFVFPQFLLENTAMVPQIRPRPLPSTRFLIQLLIIVQFKATQHQLLKTSLNKS
jgi:hypothetical protein